ncbi:MAG TPA: hypothetical protein VN045_04640, partial [Microbacteriaceae bacterium]|nr:hypothetical protein [Microbacteriaceae bacterium]
AVLAGVRTGALRAAGLRGAAGFLAAGLRVLEPAAAAEAATDPRASVAWRTAPLSGLSSSGTGDTELTTLTYQAHPTSRRNP